MHKKRTLSVEALNSILQRCRRNINGWLSVERKNEALVIMKRFYWNKEFIRQIVVYLTDNDFIDIPPYILKDSRNQLDSDYLPGLAPVFNKDFAKCQ